MRTFLLSICLLSILPLSAQKPDYQIIRTPSLSPDAKQVVFGYQGDIWLYPLPDGPARRLTIHQAYDSHPRFSPDGDSIAFVSNRYSQDDIFTMPLQGGRPHRLTYHPADDQLTDWTRQGQLLFTTERIHNQVEWDAEIYAVSAQGGTPERVLAAFGQMCAASPSGRYLALVRGSCRMSRQTYQGPAQNDIWIYDRQEEKYQAVTKTDQNEFLPRWENDSSLLFLQQKEGYYALVRKNPHLAAGPIQGVWQHKDWGIRSFDGHAQGQVWVAEGGLYWSTPAGIKRRLELGLPGDYHFYPEEPKTYSNGIEAYSIAPSGKFAALQIHGEVFVTPTDPEEKEAVNLSNHPYYDREMAWLNDSNLLFVSDRSGPYRFYQIRSADPQKPGLYASLQHELEGLSPQIDGENFRDPLLSPNGNWLAFEVDGKKLVVARIDDAGRLTDHRTLVNAWHGVSGLRWSPDSRYLAYHRDDLNFNTEVYLQSIEKGARPVNVSMHPGNDYQPVWSPDGSKLAFLSDRTGDDADVWFAWLRVEDWLKAQEEREEGYYFDPVEKPAKKEDNGDDKKKTAPAVKPLEIDTAELYRRLERVTQLNGRESQLAIDKEGEIFYFTHYNLNTEGRDLYQIKADGSELKALTEKGANPYDLQWGPKHEKLYFLDGGKLGYITPGKGQVESLPHQAHLIIDHALERRQVMKEAGELLEDRFYDPQFHGHNWDSLRAKYRPLIASASTDQDFRYAFNWMLGRLNASHMGLYGGNPEETQKRQDRLLGLELAPHPEGLKIKTVLPESPAARPANRLHQGEIITAVNGQPLKARDNFFALIEQAPREQILLSVQTEASEQRQVVIRPVSSLTMPRYRAWVNQKRALVDKWSKGRLGYLHIRGMNMRSFERFERELMASGHGKEGIVIDVRFNGGGWTTDYLLAVLSVRQHAYTIPRGVTDNLQQNHKKYSRYYPYSERLPLASWTRHSIALCNASSYSNAEIFSHAYKTLDIGTLVGQPTFGAVISTGGTSLLDGSFLRLPFRAWYVKKTHENMELGPAVPDILVENPPASRARGEDPQLKRAVAELLKQMEPE